MNAAKRARRGIGKAVILALLAMIVYDQIRLRRKPAEYRMDIATEDFRASNINLVAAPHDVYLAGGWFLELTGSGGKTKKHIEHIVLRDKIKPYSENGGGSYPIYELGPR